LPGEYQYCGPGTKLPERLGRGDPVIKEKDSGCKDHDIAYSQNRESLDARQTADRVLADRAWERVLSQDAGISEEAAAYALMDAMKLKTKLGLGLTKRKKKNSRKSLKKKAY